jgi:hypothetical protein
MEGILTVHVEFKDGRTPLDEKLPMNYPAGAEQKACMMTLAGINSAGGVLHFDKDGIELTPMSEIKSIKITAPSVVLGSSLDINSNPNRIV